MHSLFNPENPVIHFLEKVANLMLLNLVFVICCLPVITIGPAITALYYMAMKMVRDEETSIFKGFFHSFKQNFKQGILLGIVMLGLIGLLLFNWYYVRNVEGNWAFLQTVLILTCAAMTSGLLLIINYVFAVLARFYLTVKQVIVTSLVFAIRHWLCTLFMLIISAIPVFLYILPGYTYGYVLLFYFLMGFAAVAFVHSYFLVYAFDKERARHLKEQEEAMAAEEAKAAAQANEPV